MEPGEYFFIIALTASRMGEFGNTSSCATSYNGTVTVSAPEPRMSVVRTLIASAESNFRAQHPGYAHATFVTSFFYLEPN